MAKVLEGPGMELLKKWGIVVPRFVVVNSVEQLQHLAQANAWLKQESLVVKAHEAIGSRMKLGLVKLGLKYDAAEKAAKEILGKNLGGLKISQVIVSEMIPHKEEFYAAVKSTREGVEILLASLGGIEIESQWEKVKRLFVPVGQAPSPEALQKLAREAGFSKELVAPVANFTHKFYQCFYQEDGQYLEINPLVVRILGSRASGAGCGDLA